jgi:hypothetical protein
MLLVNAENRTCQSTIGIIVETVVDASIGITSKLPASASECSIMGVDTVGLRLVR